jgi:pantoate kinase
MRRLQGKRQTGDPSADNEEIVLVRGAHRSGSGNGGWLDMDWRWVFGRKVLGRAVMASSAENGAGMVGREPAACHITCFPPMAIPELQSQLPLLPAGSRAFAPANGSLVFETYEAGATHGRGSLGVGFTLDEGVVASVARLPGVTGAPHRDVAGESEIVVDGRRWDFPTVRQVIRQLALEPVRVTLTADLPFGCGFGMSGASALATAYALGAEFACPQSSFELAMVAHEAEVDQATGRGDVGGQFNGGFMMRTTLGAPLAVQWLPIGEAPVWCRIFGPISTSDVLRDAATMARVNAAGHAALEKLRSAREVDLNQLLHMSREFAEASGLLTSVRVRQSIEEAVAAGGQASMVMLGEAVVSSVPIDGARACRVVRQPARLLAPGERVERRLGAG